MTAPRRRAGRWSIARQIALLILVALLLLTLAHVVVTFAGPPPRPAPVRTSDVAAALEAGAAPRPGLLLEEALPAFEPRSGERRRPAAEARLARLLGLPPGRVRLASAEELRRAPGGGAGPDEILGDFSAGAQDEAGRWRAVRSQPRPLLTAWHRTTIAITLGVALLLALIAARVSRGIVGPIQRLAREADQAYVDGRRGPITVGGSPEIADLARTITAMRDRFADLVENRTMMLAAIAHDMATPLARLEFHVAKLPAALRGPAEADLAELSALIASILGYARGQRRLDSVPLDLVALTRDLLGRRDRPSAPVVLARAPEAAWLRGDRLSLERLISNLAGNAQRYADGGRVEIRADAASVVLTMSDDGPGFDPALAERLFEPFFRIEASRSRETAGAGLGLATARAIAEAHGGTLTASASPGRGARFVLTLPALPAPPRDGNAADGQP